MGKNSRRAFLCLGGSALAGGAVYSTYFSTTEYLASARGKRTFSFTDTKEVADGQPEITDGENTVWGTVFNRRKEAEERVNWTATERPVSLWDEYRATDYGDEFLSLIVAVLPDSYALSERRPRINGDTIHQPVGRREWTGEGPSDDLVFNYQLTKWRMNFPYPTPTSMTVEWVD